MALFPARKAREEKRKRKKIPAGRDIRRLGVTASLISGWVDRDGQTERRFVAYFSYEGIDYLIDARPTGEQDITMEWLCALLETLHK